MADSHEVQRRDFVNIVLVGLGSVMGLIIGIPAIGYLLSPAVKTAGRRGLDTTRPSRCLSPG